MKTIHATYRLLLKPVLFLAAIVLLVLDFLHVNVTPILAYTLKDNPPT